ncbi:hypothetical protein REPUB_Repub03eG0194500 [Reevesia pubescens]
MMSKLKASCLLLDSYTDGYLDRYFDVHDLVYAVAMSIACEDSFLFAPNVLQDWLDGEEMKSIISYVATLIYFDKGDGRLVETCMQMGDGEEALLWLLTALHAARLRCDNISDLGRHGWQLRGGAGWLWAYKCSCLGCGQSKGGRNETLPSLSPTPSLTPSLAPKFKDERWKNGTWDLNIFVRNGRMDWDEVIVVGRRKFLEMHPETTTSQEPV